MFPLNRCSILFSSHRLSLPKRNASKIIPQSEWNPFVFFARSKHNGDISGPSVDKTRLVKRVVAGVLFSTTLGLAIYGKQTRKKRLNEYLEGCQRLPHDPDFTSSVGSEFYRCHECVFPASTVKSGTLKQCFRHVTTCTFHNERIILSKCQGEPKTIMKLENFF